MKLKESFSQAYDEKNFIGLFSLRDEIVIREDQLKSLELMLEDNTENIDYLTVFLNDFELSLLEQEQLV